MTQFREIVLMSILKRCKEFIAKNILTKIRIICDKYRISVIKLIRHLH